MVPPLAFFLCVTNMHTRIKYVSKREQNEGLLQNEKRQGRGVLESSLCQLETRQNHPRGGNFN